MTKVILKQEEAKTKGQSAGIQGRNAGLEGWEITEKN